MKKLYADKIGTSQDERIIKLIGNLLELKENGTLYQYEIAQKAFYNKLRNEMDIKNVIGTALNEEKDTAYVYLFDIEATPDYSYDMHYDPEQNNTYIVVD